MSGSGTTTLTVSNKEMIDIFKVVKSLKLLAQTVENEAKNKDLNLLVYY